MHPHDHLRNFQSKVQRVRRLLARQIDLSKSGSLPKTELDAIYELAFLNIFVAFENDLTELFKTNMLKSHGSGGQKRSIFVPKTRALADKLLQGTGKYFQILPIEQMEKAARLHFKDGGPFVTLTAAQKDAIGKAYAIRNHIAHRSTESKKSYKKKILSQVTLSKPSYSPGYYLKSAIALNRSYFDHHVAEIGGILRDVCEAS